MMKSKSPLEKLGFFFRNIFCRDMFESLHKYCKGDVLDVGGWDFFETAKIQKVPFESWTTLEINKDRLPQFDDQRFKAVYGNGCNMEFPDNHFDTIVNIQVLEHEFEPIKMVEEIARVLKPKGYAIFVIPQTSILHYVPRHYYNFTRYWIIEAMKRSSLEIIQLKTLGGFWSSMAAHSAQFFVQSTRVEGYSSSEFKRNIFFYLLFPFMALYAVGNLIICSILSIGDLTEEPKNHLVVVQKN